MTELVLVLLIVFVVLVVAAGVFFYLVVKDVKASLDSVDSIAKHSKDFFALIKKKKDQSN